MFPAKSPGFIIEIPLLDDYTLSVAESPAKPTAALPHVEGHVIWRLKALRRVPQPGPEGPLKSGPVGTETAKKRWI